MTNPNLKAAEVNEQVMVELHMIPPSQYLVECSSKQLRPLTFFSTSLYQMPLSKMPTRDLPTTSDDLVTRVHNLPAELYNKIHDLTFKAHFEGIRRIDNNYKPPSVLQVNRKWRILLSPAFYGCTTFTVMEDDTSHLEIFTLAKWLQTFTVRQYQHFGDRKLRVISKSTIETTVEQPSNGEKLRLLVKPEARDIVTDLRRRVYYSVTPNVSKDARLRKIVLEVPISNGGAVRFRWTDCGTLRTSLGLGIDR